MRAAQQVHAGWRTIACPPTHARARRRAYDALFTPSYNLPACTCALHSVHTLVHTPLHPFSTLPHKSSTISHKPATIFHKPSTTFHKLHLFHAKWIQVPALAQVAQKLSPHAIDQMIETIKKYAAMPDPLALTRMKELLGHNVLTHEQVFEMFEIAAKLEADTAIYNIALKQASDAHDVSYARDIVDFMENTPGVEPNSETYRLQIAAHTGTPNFKEAGEVLEKLITYGESQPEHYAALIELYGGEGELALCVETYSRFIAEHKPDADIMSAMVEVFVKNNQTEHALMVVAKMRDEHMRIPIRVFNAILTLCKNSSKKTAMVLQFLKSVNTAPNSDTLEIIKDDLDYQTLLSLWAQVAKTQYPVPVETMQLMLARCAKEVDLVRINELARDVQKLSYGLRATTPLINSILKALVDAKETPEKVWQMYQTLIAIIEEPDKETFEVLISYFAKIDNARAFKLYESMQKQQLALSDPVCNALLLAVPRATKPTTNAVVAQLVHAGAELGLTPSRAALEHVVAMVPHDHMAQFTQLIQRRKKIEIEEEKVYQEQEKKRKIEEKRRREEENEQEKEEEERRRKDLKRKEEEGKKKEEEYRKREAELKEEKRKREEEKRKREEEKRKREEEKRQRETKEQRKMTAEQKKKEAEQKREEEKKRKVQEQRRKLAELKQKVKEKKQEAEESKAEVESESKRGRPKSK